MQEEQDYMMVLVFVTVVAAVELGQLVLRVLQMVVVPITVQA
jgi:hypothetical protein